jgi:hypothetical protein
MSLTALQMEIKSLFKVQTNDCRLTTKLVTTSFGYDESFTIAAVVRSYKLLNYPRNGLEL